MEMLEDKIKKFIAIDAELDNASGYGNSSGDGSGLGSGAGNSCGAGHGFGLCDGTGYNYGLGYGEGSADGYGYNTCSGDGRGFNFGVTEINGLKVYIIDDSPTIITSVRANVAQGFLLKSDLQTIPCYIVKEKNVFAHGSTLRSAFNCLHEKLYEDSTEEERIEAFKKKFPEYDVKYNNKDLFIYHHVLTGSCKMGREAFMSNNGLSLDGKTSIREFVELTKDSYGGEIIKKLPIVYGME